MGTTVLHRESGAPQVFPSTWIMFQKWRHLLFASWPFSPAAMRPHVPANLELDTFDGQAWLSILPMHMEDLHFRWLPPIPFTSDFPEINMRTYVRIGERRGIYFFSIDAASWLGSLVASRFFHTPYRYAHMKLEERGDHFHMRSRRNASGHVGAADFEARYVAIGEPQPAPEGSLAEFLTNRDTALAVTNGRLYAGPVYHPPWLLTDAEAEFTVNTLPTSVGITLPHSPPVLHFSWGTDTQLCMVEHIPG